jgi:hypothetical protein
LNVKSGRLETPKRWINNQLSALSRKGLSAVAIYDDLVATLGAAAVSYSSATRYLREAIFASSNPPDPLPLPEHQLDDSDQAILLALADPPFASIRELS